MFILLILIITIGTIFIAKRSTREKGRGMLRKKKKITWTQLTDNIIPKAETTFCIMLQSCQDFFFFFPF